MTIFIGVIYAYKGLLLVSGGCHLFTSWTQQAAWLGRGVWSRGMPHVSWSARGMPHVSWPARGMPHVSISANILPSLIPDIFTILYLSAGPNKLATWWKYLKEHIDSCLTMAVMVVFTVCAGATGDWFVECLPRPRPSWPALPPDWHQSCKILLVDTIHWIHQLLQSTSYNLLESPQFYISTSAAGCSGNWKYFQCLRGISRPLVPLELCLGSTYLVNIFNKIKF